MDDLQQDSSGFVSVFTNNAIDLIRAPEVDLSIPFSGMPDYESIMNNYYMTQCLHRGHRPAAKPSTR